MKNCGFGIVTIAAWMGVAFVTMALPQQGRAQTDPSAFTTIVEYPQHGKPVNITGTNVEVDDRSIIKINFNAGNMTPPRPLVTDGPTRPRVQIRIEAYSSKGASRSPIAPIPHYVDLLPAPTSAASSSASYETTNPGTIVYHDRFYNPEIGAGAMPATEFNLLGTQAGGADFIEIRVTNLQTQEAMITTLAPKQFGFRAKVSDSLMFIARRGVGASAKTAGVDAVNFVPSPGVTYGGTYLPRAGSFGRFLQPGIGISLLFTSWKDPAFDVSTGLFAKGTKAADMQIGLGPQISLFGNILQFTYGWNLQANLKRQYFGVGVSFVNMTTKIASLIAK
jgi:hypothetical protein